MIESTTKIASIVSVVVGVMLSVVGYFANAKLTSLEAGIRGLQQDAAKLENAKDKYNSFSRLSTEFSLPLAKSFALQYVDYTSGVHTAPKIGFPPVLLAEFTKVLEGWGNRRDLMTGQPCKPEGLKARQVVTLMIENLGYADALNVSLKAITKAPPNDSLMRPWQEIVDGQPVWYSNLTPGMDGWKSAVYPIGTLRGQSSKKENVTAPTDKVQYVLASVSGRTDLFGTVVVPLEISWTDSMSQETYSAPVLLSDAATLAADLAGAEIGTVGSNTCR